MQKGASYVIRDMPLVLDRSPFDQEYPLMIRDLPPEGKPREKLMAHGPEALTVAELAALLIVTGTTREDVLVMTDRIIREYGEKNVFEERNPAVACIPGIKAGSLLSGTPAMSLTICPSFAICLRSR
jgi:hypothetical protein